MNPQCARCGRVVYPTEKVNCLDKYWHKGCFHCEVCKMTLNMNTYKGYDKKPYCNAHYPKQSFTTVTDTPENLRLKQQSEIQSQVKYKRDFEESKGRGFSIVTDTPELQRLKKTQEQISNASAPEDQPGLEQMISNQAEDHELEVLQPGPKLQLKRHQKAAISGKARTERK